jgi:hypothetical protein
MHPQLKVAYRGSSRKDYDEQICRALDRGERLRAFDLAMALEAVEAQQSNSRDDELSIDGRKRAIDRTTVQHLTSPKRSIPNFFTWASRHTFCTETTAFHLNRRFEIYEIPSAARKYRIQDDFMGALADFFIKEDRFCPLWFNERSGGVPIGGRRVHTDISLLQYKKIRVWPYVRVQTKSVQLHRRVNPPANVQARPSDSKWPYGRRDTCILKNYDPLIRREGHVDLNGGASPLASHERRRSSPPLSRRKHRRTCYDLPTNISQRR